ncbi:MAG TPA: hypothetical protein VN493_26665 [Thermoanaerobaculia bacterium]|nr:hypothetical protein [Thermoanaerobaculia bacterium]
MEIRTSLLLSALLSCFLLPRAYGTASLAEQGQRPCVSYSELAFGGIPIGADENFVRQKLGKPLKKEAGQSEDDGGHYEVTQLTYPEIRVDIGRGGRIESLFTRSKGVALPSGVRIGMSRDQVLAKWPLEDQRPEHKPSHLSVAVCDDHNAPVLEFFIAFDAHDRLAEAEINLYGP